VAPVNIRDLKEVPEAVPELAAWFEAEWAPHYGPDGPGDAAEDLAECLEVDGLPRCLVALDPDGAVAGTIALKAASISHHQLTPWGGAFLVARKCRGRGVGTALVAALEELARTLKFARVYMSTDTALGLLQRRGWCAFDTAPSLRGTVHVCVVDL